MGLKFLESYEYAIDGDLGNVAVIKRVGFLGLNSVFNDKLNLILCQI